MLRTSRGTTLVELLASMTILSVILLLLGSTLELSLARFRSGMDQSEASTDVNIALRWLRRDLDSSVIARHAELPKLPDNVTPEQRQFFEDKIFFPFEISRLSGDGGSQSYPVSLPNAAPEFDSIAFVSHQPVDPSLNPEALTKDMATHASLVAYYVAYTRNSPLAGSTASSMKLFRHVRTGGDSLQQGHAQGFLLHLSHLINDDFDETGANTVRDLTDGNPALVRLGIFENSLLPGLLTNLTMERETLEPTAAVAAWPNYPITDLLVSTPPTLQPDRGTAEEWKQPGHGIHDAVFPDEAICHNVVHFEITPFRKVSRSDGSIEWMDARELNQYLGLSQGEEWPVLVPPSVLEVTLATVDPLAANQLLNYKDWLVNWAQISSDSGGTAHEEFLRRHLTVQRIRIPIRSEF